MFQEEKNATNYTTVTSDVSSVYSVGISEMPTDMSLTPSATYANSDSVMNDVRFQNINYLSEQSSDLQALFAREVTEYFRYDLQESSDHNTSEIINTYLNQFSGNSSVSDVTSIQQLQNITTGAMNLRKMKYW